MMKRARLLAMLLWAVWAAAMLFLFFHRRAVEARSPASVAAQGRVALPSPPISPPPAPLARRATRPTVPEWVQQLPTGMSLRDLRNADDVAFQAYERFALDARLSETQRRGFEQVALDAVKMRNDWLNGLALRRQKSDAEGYEAIDAEARERIGRILEPGQVDVLDREIGPALDIVMVAINVKRGYVR